MRNVRRNRRFDFERESSGKRHVRKCFLESYTIYTRIAATRTLREYMLGYLRGKSFPLHARRSSFWSTSSRFRRNPTGRRCAVRGLPYLNFRITPANNGWKVKGLTPQSRDPFATRASDRADESLSRRSLLSSIGPPPYTVIAYTISTAR